MLYRLWFRDGVGHPVTMTGYKLVKDDAGFDIWKDTTTLFTRVLQGHVPEGGDEDATVLASGMIVIRARDFAKQLTTFRGGRLGAMALVKFGVIFVQQLAEAYLRKGTQDACPRVRPSGSRPPRRRAAARPTARACSACSPAAR